MIFKSMCCNFLNVYDFYEHILSLPTLHSYNLHYHLKISYFVLPSISLLVYHIWYILSEAQECSVVFSHSFLNKRNYDICNEMEHLI